MARDRFDLYISEAILHEIRAGDPDAVARRLASVDGLAILAVNEDVRALVEVYDRRLGLVGRARADVPHFAFAVTYEMDYLVTWNCAHIANGEMIRRLLDVNADLNRFTPLILTPEAILEPLKGGEP